MKNVKTTIFMTLIGLLLLLIIIIPTNVQAVSNEDLELNIDVSNIQERRVAVDILLHNSDTGIMFFSGFFHYDKEIFKTISSRNITTEIDDDVLASLSYSNTTDRITIYFNDDIVNVGKIVTINLEINEGVDIDNISDLSFSLGRPAVYSDTIDEDIDLETIEKSIKLKDDEPTPDNPTQDGLYLSTPLYKIGDSDIENYIAGDKYISKISQETTKQAFIHHLSTNGEIRILKHDGSELQDDEFVGTGMTLEVTKDEEIITLKIAVDGDLDGNGKVTATDLSTLNQTLLKLISLEDEYFLAADLDDSKKLTATDLSTEIKILTKVI